MALRNLWPVSSTNWKSASTWLSAALGFAYVLGWLPATRPLVQSLVFRGDWGHPWTVVTYALASLGSGSDFVFFVLGLVWVYMVGGAIERASGWRTLLIAFFGFAGLSAILGGLCAPLAGAPLALAGPWLAATSLTCLWAGRSPTTTVLLMALVPIQLRWLALVLALSDVFLYGSGSPVVGLAVAAPCALAWFLGKGAFAKRRSEAASGRGQKARSAREFEAYIDRVRSKEKERDERERLRRLFDDGPDGTSDPR